MAPRRQYGWRCWSNTAHASPSRAVRTSWSRDAGSRLRRSCRPCRACSPAMSTCPPARTGVGEDRSFRAVRGGRGGRRAHADRRDADDVPEDDNRDSRRGSDRSRLDADGGGGGGAGRARDALPRLALHGPRRGPHRPGRGARGLARRQPRAVAARSCRDEQSRKPVKSAAGNCPTPGAHSNRGSIFHADQHSSAVTGDDLCAERDLDPVDIAFDRHVLVGMNRQRRVVRLAPLPYRGPDTRDVGKQKENETAIIQL